MRFHCSSRSCLSFPKLPPKVIEAITNSRESQPSFDAVYMLTPTSANIDRIIRDFSGGRQQYAGAHLFFIDGPSLLPYIPLTLPSSYAIPSK